MNCQNLKLKYEELLNLQNEFQIINAEFQKMKPSTVAERRAVSDELLRKQENITKFIEDNFNSILWQEKIIKSEKETLEKYFNQTIDVPKLPKEITREKLEFWKQNGFAIHYSPGIEITEDNTHPGQNKKLDSDIYRWIKDGKISPETAKLPKGWILVDTRPKPQYDNGDQMYENDILNPVLEKLRKENHIKTSDNLKNKGARFRISHDELNKTEVKTAISEILKVNPNQLSLPPATLYNYIGNVFYPEWGETNIWEWFKEEFGTSGSRLCGGSSDRGGLSYVSHYSGGDRRDDFGFRPLVVFS